MTTLRRDRQLDPQRRKANGVFYTPPALVEHVARHTVQSLRCQRPLVLDPACGDGAFLSACRSQRVDSQLFGVDIDAVGIKTVQRELGDFAGIKPANALLGPELPGGIDWQREFPEAMQAGGFDVVIGNPPWGQKAIDVDDELKRYLWQRYPSSVGIFDWFRPFVELSVRLLKPGGRFGMVLPDIVLLKDYPATRRFLLDQLTIERIEWWGKAFTDATIDVATIIGTKRPAASNHAVHVEIHDAEKPLRHSLPQADFHANPRCTFNLHLTSKRRQVLDQLSRYPRLGECFEIHEGVHSGNIRAELFVDGKVDDSCKPLLFGREEIVPYQLRWSGGFIRLSAAPLSRSPERYANLGRPEWHLRPKLLVRRTGDRVLAAVDEEGRHASNNFFLVFPFRAGDLDLHGLCALLNSRLMTWYFRAIEPRQGRAFAELKIKHLRTFPLPTRGGPRLNELGRRCVSVSERGPLQAEIDALVLELFDLASEPEA